MSKAVKAASSKDKNPNDAQVIVITKTIASEAAIAVKAANNRPIKSMPILFILFLCKFLLYSSTFSVAVCHMDAGQSQ
jgi:hypothetical protein